MNSGSHFQTAANIAAQINSRSLSPETLIEPYLSQIASYNKDYGVYLSIDHEYIENQIAHLQQLLNVGQTELPLAGVPIGIKDNILTKGLRTTAASKMLEDFMPPYDATVITRLRQAGAIIIGKLNCDEFAMGSSNEHSAFMPTRNPWNREYVAGGSSGGSAACVAASMALASLGSDTGGSIRLPASYCGVVGFRPSYGRISRSGLIAFGSSLDQIGPLSRSVEDAILLYNVLAGPDRNDSTSLPESHHIALSSLKSEFENSSPLKGLKIGLIDELMVEDIDASVRQAVEDSTKKLESLGAKIKRVSLPLLNYALSCYYIIANAEASANLARYDGIRFGLRVETHNDTLQELYIKTRSQGFGREVKQRIMLGTFALSTGYYKAYYHKAEKVRYLIKQEFSKVFESCDVLVCPTTPTTAFKLGEKTDDSLAMYLNDRCVIGPSLAQLPAISLPCGYDETGLPIGLQLIGSYLGERVLFKVALGHEQLYLDKQKWPVL